MITKLMAALSAGQLALCSTHALCAPVAVVEEVKGNPPDIEFMDYVEPGRVIRLGAEDSVVLGYLESCMREAITGGTATVGTQQSSVELGKVERTKVACDAGHMLLSAEQASQTAAMVFRRGPSEPAQPQFTLYGLSPVVEVKGGGTVVIERVGKSRERYVVTLERKELEREAFYDFSNAGKALTAGGIYRAAWNEQQLVFQIASDALPGHAPVIGRLLRFSPRN